MPLGSSRKGSVKATPAQVTAGLLAYVECGTFKRAGKQLGIPWETIRDHANADPEQVASIRLARAQARKADIAKAVKDSAKNLPTVLARLEVLSESGDKDQAVQVQAARAYVQSVCLVENVRKLDAGEVTERSEVIDPAAVAREEREALEALKADPASAGWIERVEAEVGS